MCGQAAAIAERDVIMRDVAEIDDGGNAAGNAVRRGAGPFQPHAFRTDRQRSRLQAGARGRPAQIGSAMPSTWARARGALHSISDASSRLVLPRKLATRISAGSS